MNELELWLSRGNDFPIFPREIFVKNRKRFLRRFDVMSLDKVRIGKNEYYYVDIYSKWQLKNNIIDTVMLDIDFKGISSKPKECLEFGFDIVKDLDDFLSEYNVGISRVYISGTGYHVYVDFAPVKIDTDFRTYYMNVYEFIMNNWKYGKDYLDMKYAKINPYTDLVPGKKNIKYYKQKLFVFPYMRIDWRTADLMESIGSRGEWYKFDVDLALAFGV